MNCSTLITGLAFVTELAIALIAGLAFIAELAIGCGSDALFQLFDHELDLFALFHVVTSLPLRDLPLVHGACLEFGPEVLTNEKTRAWPPRRNCNVPSIPRPFSSHEKCIPSPSAAAGASTIITTD